MNGLDLPECWLENGANSLAVFDEDGNSSAGVQIVVEADASRTTTKY
ncbi:MAG: hypothetical protein JO250_01640 [Armatimonadetes bacterium]|nr:hypothetical protein [Armatimonadota bacterium]